MHEQDRQQETELVASPLIVESKLRIPPPPQPMIPRQRLLNFVQGQSGARRIYVTGPAGIGKSTFLSQWCRERQMDSIVIWVSLDDLDIDISRLWAHIFEAAELGSPSLGAEAANAMRTGSPLIDVALPLFLNDLELCNTTVVIALDDVHRIGQGPAVESLAALAERVPEGTILATSSRRGLGSRERRWVLHGQAVHVPNAELRFNLAESESLLEQISDLPLEEATIHDALAATRGWVVPLRLIASNLRYDVDGSVPALEGERLIDYLHSEILANLSSEELGAAAFLAHMERFNRHFVAEVVPTGLPLLSPERREQLGIIDLGGGWFTLHQLIRDAFRRRVEAAPSTAQLVATAEWHASRNLTEEALTFAMAADAWDLAADLVNESWPSYIMAGRVDAMANLVEIASSRKLGSDDRVIVTAAWVAGWQHDLAERDRLLDIIDSRSDSGPLPDGSSSIHHAAALNRALIPADFQSLVTSAQIAKELTTKDSPWKAFALMGEATALLAEGDFVGCCAVYLAAADLSAPLLQAACVGSASMAAALQGDFKTADELAARAGLIRVESRFEHVEWLVFDEVTLGYVALHRGAASEAVGHLTAAHEGFEHMIEPYPDLVALLGLAKAHHVQGDRALAAAALSSARARAGAAGDIGDYFESALQEATVAYAPERPLAHAMAIEPLTAREQQVLKLLAATRLSQSEIANNLYISHNTVKTHTKAIYKKLHVASRGRAAERATSLGLV